MLRDGDFMAENRERFELTARNGPVAGGELEALTGENSEI
jgi:hypothetical protein